MNVMLVLIAAITTRRAVFVLHLRTLEDDNARLREILSCMVEYKELWVVPEEAHGFKSYRTRRLG